MCPAYQNNLPAGSGEGLFPDALQILDFYHLAENRYRFGKRLFGGDEKLYTPRAEGLIGLLRGSRTEEALKRAEPHKDRKLPPRTVNPYTYIGHNRNKADCAEYKRQGRRIGSGPVESANKTVAQKRRKQAGMMRNERNAQYMLALKSKEESGLRGSPVRGFISTAAYLPRKRNCTHCIEKNLTLSG